MSSLIPDPTDPFGFKREREIREEQARTGNAGGGCGLLSLPLLIPVFLLFGGLIYPVTGLASLAVWLATHQLTLAFGLKGSALLIAPWIPTLPVMWLACRWDTRMGDKNKIYRRVRHVARLLCFAVLLVFMSGIDTPPRTTDAQVLHHFFHSPELWGVTLVILAVLHFVLASENGVIKTLWHTLLDLLRMRPAGRRF